ncbi:MAG: thioredoxin family protein [Candidatus Bipolaricaulota bacterium]
MALRTVVVLMLAAGVSLGALAADPVVVVFTQEGCPECERMKPVLEELAAAYPNVGFRTITDSDPDALLLWSLAGQYGVLPSHFPVIFVGSTALVGATRDHELRLRAAVEDCASRGCPSPLADATDPTVPWLAALLAGLALVLVLFLLFAAGT